MNYFLLLAAALLFPSVTEIWKNGPLTDSTFQIPEAKTFAPADQLQAQVRRFRQLPSRAQRSRMALEFGKAGNPEAFRMVLRLINEEKNSFVRDNLFQALYQLQTGGHAPAGLDLELFPKYFTDPSPAVRGTAMYLYLTAVKNNDPSKVIESIRNEKSIFVLNRIAPPLLAKAADISKSLAGNLYQEAAADNIALRALAAELIARQENPDDSKLLREILPNAHPLIRMHIARGLSANPTKAADLLSTIAADPNPAVRLAAASILKPDPERENILEKLLGDPAASVRAAAAEALGRSKSESAAEILTEKLTDPEIMVRRKVAESLSKLKPPESIHRIAVEMAENHPDARRQVLDFLIATNDRNYSSVIRNWIKQSTDPFFLREAADALGKLNCTDAGDTLIRLAQSKDPLVRRAAARSMGLLKIPQTYPALIRLGRDRMIQVAEAAFLSMYKIDDPSFVPEFERMIGKLTEDGINCRAIACRALAAHPLKPGVIAGLNKLITQRCIKIPMAGPMVDLIHPRISALMLLLEHAKKGNSAARKAYQADLEFLLKQKVGSDFRNEDFDEYLRQIRAFEAGKPVRPKTVDTVRPSFTAEPLKKEK